MSRSTARRRDLDHGGPPAGTSVAGAPPGVSVAGSAVLQRALERILPPGVVGRVATAEMWEAELPPEEAGHVRGAVPRRRREFAAGRSAARSALAELGLHDVTLPADEDRVPRWPDGVAGSISHCDGLCVAAAGDDAGLLGLGLDVEPATPMEPRLVSRVCTPREEAWGRLAVSRLDPCLLYKIVFTAKEAVYKCCFPRTRRELEFHDVEVTPSPPTGAFEAEIDGAPPGSPAPFGSPSDPRATPLPSRLEGRFTLEGGYLLTAVAWKDG